MTPRLKNLLSAQQSKTKLWSKTGVNNFRKIPPEDQKDNALIWETLNEILMLLYHRMPLSGKRHKELEGF